MQLLLFYFQISLGMTTLTATIVTYVAKIPDAAKAKDDYHYLF